MKSRKFLIAALLFPILALGWDAWSKHLQRNAGVEITLPITGFDPRDLLSGHYLTYRIDYGVTEECPESQGDAAICLRPERRFVTADELPARCDLYIRGYCDERGHFISGNERFYIPEEYAQALEEQVRDKHGELLLSVDKQGNAAILDLLIDGKPWKETIR